MHRVIFKMYRGSDDFGRGTNNFSWYTADLRRGIVNFGWGIVNVRKGTDNLRWGTDNLQWGIDDGRLPFLLPIGFPSVSKTGVWQGTLALMVLKMLETLGPLHGYEATVPASPEEGLPEDSIALAFQMRAVPESAVYKGESHENYHITYQTPPDRHIRGAS